MSGHPPQLGYQNNFDESDDYTYVRHFPGKGLTAAELNESQDIQDIKRIKFQRTLMKEGEVVTGANPVVRPNGDVVIPAGGIYVNNDIRNYEEASFTIPVDQIVKLGVYLQVTIADSTDDPELLDPSNVAIPGASYATSGLETSQRQKEAIVWGYELEDGTPSEAEGVFYPSATVDNGILINEGELPILDGVAKAIAKYSRDTDGNSIIEGLQVDFSNEDLDENEFVFDVQAGLAYVNGFPIERSASDKFFVAVDPDLEAVVGDPSIVSIQTLTFSEELTKGAADGADQVSRPTVAAVLSVSDGTTNYVEGVDFQLTGNTIDWSLAGVEPTTGETYTVSYQFEGSNAQVDRGPIDNISAITAELRVSETLVRGTVANTLDPLTNIPAVRIIEITQGPTTFTENVDYVLNGSDVDWSLGGAEPVANTSYDVVYTYNANVLPDSGSIANRDFTIAKDQVGGELEDGSTLQIDYEYRLQRTDILQLTSVGTLERIKGSPSRSLPVAPSPGNDAIPLAAITFDYIDDPFVQAIGNKVVKQERIEFATQQIVTLFDLVSELQLTVKGITEGATNSGIFTDPFTDDTKTDIGVAQSTIITGNTLTLPITVKNEELDEAANDEYQTLDFTLEDIITQEQSTGVTKINPFATFDPPGAIEVFNPIDHRAGNFTEQAIINAQNSSASSVSSNIAPPRLTPGPITGGPTPVPPLPKVSTLPTFSETRDLVLTAKGKNRLKPKGRRQLVRLQTKLNSGENISQARIGKHLIQLPAGTVLKKFK